MSERFILVNYAVGARCFDEEGPQLIEGSRLAAVQAFDTLGHKVVPKFKELKGNEAVGKFLDGRINSLQCAGTIRLQAVKESK